MRPFEYIPGIVIALTVLWASSAFADIQKIYISQEIDDDHIIIVTKSGEQLLLEKWTLRFSPLSFEGKYFISEISPMWVTIHFDDRDPIKWSIEENLGTLPSEEPQDRSAEIPPSSSRKTGSQECYKSGIREPQPFLGNGGEIIILDDGSIWKEVSYQYLYLYEYSPSVIVCPSTGKMILGSHVFQVVPVK